MTFSIITVSYNSEKTIRRTIESVLNQTCEDYEYIIIDGASSDHTLDIIREFEPCFNGRLRWISEPDSGIYNAMNKGIMMSKGEIIGIVNSDDWLELGALDVVLNEILKDTCNKHKLISGEVLFHYEDGKTQLFPTSYERYVHYSKKYKMGLNHPATFVPREIYDKIGLFDEDFKLYADADFVVRCYKNNVGVCFIHKILSNMSDGGVSNQRSFLVLKDGLRKIKKHSRSALELYYLSLRLLLNWFLISLIPSWGLRWYRKIYNKK